MSKIVICEQARSGRSTCRATGEPIGKDEWRCGFETFLGGRMAMAWMKPLPFLQSCCRVEYAASAGGSQGACKATGRKFQKGDVRFVLTAGDPQKKAYLSLGAAAAELAPVLAHVGRRSFAPVSISGLEDLAADDRQAFYQAFAVGSTEAARFERQHPAPERPAFHQPGSAAKAAAAEAASSDGARGGSTAAGGEQAAAGGRPAKRARAAKAAATEDEQQQQQQQAEQQQQQQQQQQKQQQEQSSAGLTDYELQRLEQIRRNRERMQSLGLPGLAHELMPAPPPKPAAAKHKGVSRKRLSEVLPRRESSRIRGIAPDGTQVHAERQGEVVVVQGEVIRRYAAGGGMTEEMTPQERHPQGDLVFCSTNGSPATDEAFVQLLAHAAAAANSGSSPAKGASPSKKKGRAAATGGPLQAAAAARLALAEDDVAKVCKDAITHLQFHPTTDTLIIACADKKGSMGIWHVEEGAYELPASARRAEPILRRPIPASPAAAAAAAAAEQEDGPVLSKPAAASEGAVSLDAAASAGANEPSASGSEGAEEEGAGNFDGVLSLQAQHYEYICGLKWAGGAGRGAALFSAAYDGSLRRLDVSRGVSELVVASDEAEYSCMDVSADGRTALLGDKDGVLQLVDIRAPGGGSGARVGAGHVLHARKLNTVHLEPTSEQVFVTASTDATVRLWDLRALSSSSSTHLKPLATAQHAKGCQAAQFAPDGSRRVASTSFDDSVRTWEGAKELAPQLSIKHDNNTGRWVLPFRAVWTAAGDGVIIGNMHRKVDVFDASTGALSAQLHSEYMTAIPSRNIAHPALPVLAAATNSGRVHIYRRAERSGAVRRPAAFSA